MSNKIFCIGFHKTGTTSLAKALTILGYKVTGPNGIHDPNISQNVYEMAFHLVDKYDAFQDNPWPIIFKQIDERYPGNKFILTLRPTEEWIKSIVRHFGTDTTPMRAWIYGVGYPKGNEDTYILRYNQHNEEVLNYFKDRPDDLLVLKITEGDGWDKLCSFLNRKAPGITFPHENRAENRGTVTLSGFNKLLFKVPKTPNDK
jgi:hypothetical protein